MPCHRRSELPASDPARPQLLLRAAHGQDGGRAFGAVSSPHPAPVGIAPAGGIGTACGLVGIVARPAIGEGIAVLRVGRDYEPAVRECSATEGTDPGTLPVPLPRHQRLSGDRAIVTAIIRS